MDFHLALNDSNNPPKCDVTNTGFSIAADKNGLLIFVIFLGSDDLTETGYG